MANPIQAGADGAPHSALARNRAAIDSLPGIARRLRFSTSRRSKIYAAVGLRPRRIDLVFRALTVAIIGLLLVLPIGLVTVYFGLIASDQYQSEARFTLRASATADKPDVFGSVTGVPGANGVQAAQIVVNFLTSPSLIADLEQKGGFREAYSAPSIDRLSRLPADSPAEARLRYWSHKVQASVDTRSGIVTVSVRAFSPEAAQTLLKTIVTSSEAVINGMNDQVWADATQAVQAQVDRARAALTQARLDLQSERDQAGILSVEDASRSLTALVTRLEQDRLALDGQLQASTSEPLDPAAERALRRQIDGKRAQIEQLRQRIAGKPDSGASLADLSSRFADLELQQASAEQQLSTSAAALANVRAASQRQMVYLDDFLAPTLPESADYPRRGLWIAGTLIASLLVTAIALGLASVLRRRLD